MRPLLALLTAGLILGVSVVAWGRVAEALQNDGFEQSVHNQTNP